MNSIKKIYFDVLFGPSYSRLHYTSQIQDRLIHYFFLKFDQKYYIQLPNDNLQELMNQLYQFQRLEIL